MKKETKLFNAITDVKSEHIEEARTEKLKQKRFNLKRLTALAACAALVFGAVSMLPKTESAEYMPLKEVVFPKAYAFEDYDSRRQVFESNPVEDSFISGVNLFSYKTASEILKNSEGNVNYSPLSLYYALSLVASGADGQTADEIMNLLNASDKKTLSEQCSNLYRLLYKDNEIGKLKIANSLWMEKKVKWKDSFVKNAADNFYAHSFSCDFSDKKTGKAMAKWISDNTNGVLEPKIDTDRKQILSIINTIYFYDEWSNEFRKENTEKDKFHLSDKKTLKCDFMNKINYGIFVKGDGFSRSSLGLKNNGEMVFILPDEGVSPQELLSTPEKTKAIFEDGEKGYLEITWKVPKFSFDSKMKLNEMLRALGVNSAFEKNADFSGMSDQPSYIDSVRQETHIGIDEKGVEAAAFTLIDYVGAGAPENKAEMILNRPFIYGIKASDGTLLFMGICYNPAA